MSSILYFVLVLIFTFGGEEANECEEIQRIKSSFQEFPRMISLSSHVRTPSAPPVLRFLNRSFTNRDFPLPELVVNNIQEFLNLHFQKGPSHRCGRPVPITTCRLLSNHPLFQCPAFQLLLNSVKRKDLYNWRFSSPTRLVYKISAWRRREIDLLMRSPLRKFIAKNSVKIDSYVEPILKQLGDERELNEREFLVTQFIEERSNLKKWQKMFLREGVNRRNIPTIKETSEMRFEPRQFNRTFRLGLEFSEFRWIRISCFWLDSGDLIRKKGQIKYIEFRPASASCVVSLKNGRDAVLLWNDAIFVKFSIKMGNELHFEFQ